MQLKKKDIVYYARILPKSRIYDVLELTVRTVKDTWFVGIEKRNKQAFLFTYNDIDNIIFFNRKDALDKVLNAEKEAPETSDETMYEEY